MKTAITTLALLLLCSSIPAAHAGTRENERQLKLQAATAFITAHSQDTQSPLSTDELRRIILDSKDWTIAAQEEDGRFRYEYLPFEDKYLNDDRIVRQAGTFSVLAEIYRHQEEKDETTAAALEAAVAYFASLNQEGAAGEYEFWCIRNSYRSLQCDLGATALALIGLLNVVDAEPDLAEAYAETIDKYGAYIMAAKLPGRGFSRRYLTDDGMSSSESSFFTGEAMLALVRYYEYQEDASVRTMLEETFTYIAASEFETGLYLWAMAALKDMQSLWPNPAYVAYAERFTISRLASMKLRHDTPSNYCATVEGFTSAYSVLDSAGPSALLTSLHGEIDFWLRKMASLQLHKEQPYRVAWVDGKMELLKLPDPAQAAGGFLTGHDHLTQRIDFTQHCASAYMQKLASIDGGRL